MALTLESILGGSTAEFVSKIISQFKLDPAKKADLQAAVEQNAAILAQKDVELQEKLADQAASEIAASAEIIKAEATSQSWLPRNVRPLLLLLWGAAITVNQLVPIIARFWVPGLQPFPIDPWVYKLTAIGYTGYVGFRSWEKLQDSDK